MRVRPPHHDAGKSAASVPPAWSLTVDHHVVVSDQLHLVHLVSLPPAHTSTCSCHAWLPKRTPPAPRAPLPPLKARMSAAAVVECPRSSGLCSHSHSRSTSVEGPRTAARGATSSSISPELGTLGHGPGWRESGTLREGARVWASRRRGAGRFGGAARNGRGGRRDVGRFPPAPRTTAPQSCKSDRRRPIHRGDPVLAEARG
mmetsp:Transcript_32214/g.75639  ORF Transcript_32214/g.75639 Transcript_32214/m.75639 type:complete len:202 (-) Transcript_32214:344-949(-)